MTNEYSKTWFELFLETIDPLQTAKEVSFIRQALAQPKFRGVLDLCCGTGRHSRALAEAGYEVTGVDQSADALNRGRQRGTAVRYMPGDIRELSAVGGPYDAVINLWQSFGYHDEATNRNTLEKIRAIVRPQGRLILDLYNREFFVGRSGERTFTKNGAVVRETKALNGNRLSIKLDYPNGSGDRFEWQLYAPDELCELLEKVGFFPLSVCSNFEHGTQPSAALPRMQFISEATDLR